MSLNLLSGLEAGFTYTGSTRIDASGIAFGEERY